jgi:hypothetical protein
MIGARNKYRLVIGLVLLSAGIIGSILTAENFGSCSSATYCQQTDTFDALWVVFAIIIIFGVVESLLAAFQIGKSPPTKPQQIGP